MVIDRVGLIGRHRTEAASAAGLGTWLVAAGVAIQGQRVAISAQHPEDARPWLFGAAVIGLASVWLIERGVTDCETATVQAPSGQVSTRRRRGGLVLLALGGLYALTATLLLLDRSQESAATALWVAALLASAVGALLLQPWHIRRQAVPWLEVAALGVILAIGVWLRLPNLATIPPEVHGDEASIGLDARKILQGQMPAVFATGWYDVPALSFTFHAASMRLFGDNLFGLRMASAIESVLSVIVLFLLARRLWGPRVAVLAAAFMTFAAWHIQFSRTGFHYMQAPLTTLLAVYFLLRAIQDRRSLDWLLTGFAIGLSFEVYFAARLTPVIIAVYLAYCALTERTFLRTHLSGVLTLVFGAAVFLAPMLAVFALNPTSFNARTAGVLLIDPANLQHELSAYRVQTLTQVLVIQVQRTLEAFNILGETSLQYAHPAPLMDFWTGALLAMSALAVLFQPESRRGFLLAVWVWLGLFAGSVMTVDALFSPRVLMVLPALVLGPAIILDYAWRAATNLGGPLARYAFAAPACVVLALVLQANVRDYFDVQVVERAPADRFTLLARYAQVMNDRYQLYVIGRDDWTTDYETPRFLVPGADAVNVRNGPLDLPLSAIPADKGVAFVVETGADDYTQRVAAIRSAYPDGQETVVSERPGNPTFTAYVVDHTQLVAAHPSATRN